MGLKCKETALGPPFHLPCGKPADFIVGWSGMEDANIPMCWMCADHNVRNRHGEKRAITPEDEAAATT